MVVDYDLLPAYTDAFESMLGDAVLYDEVGSNVVVDSTAMGMPALSGDDFFTGCDVVVSGRFVNQRMAPCPLEPCAAGARGGSTAGSTCGCRRSTCKASACSPRRAASTPRPCAS